MDKDLCQSVNNQSHLVRAAEDMQDIPRLVHPLLPASQCRGAAMDQARARGQQDMVVTQEVLVGLGLRMDKGMVEMGCLWLRVLGLVQALMLLVAPEV